MGAEFAKNKKRKKNLKNTLNTKGKIVTKDWLQKKPSAVYREVERVVN